MTTTRAIALLARVQWWAFLHRARISLRENRLLTATIAAFLSVYAVAAYVLVGRGIEFVHRLPLLGPLLTERLVYLLFFFFFCMLVISNATITGMGLFRKRETGWQVALPIPPRSLVIWKTLEGMLLASWGLIVLSAPILVALGRTLHAGLSFYLASAPALLCLVAISANLSTWFLLAAVRWARNWWKWPLLAVTAIILGSAAHRMWTTSGPFIEPGDIAANVNQILKHTEVCVHPLLPSSWVSEAILASGRQAPQRALFFNLTLLSHALVSLMLTGFLASRWFPPCWDRVMTSGVTRTRSDRADVWFKKEPVAPALPRWLAWTGLKRASLALLTKDVLTFLREPAQWGQSTLIFGLLFIYTSNLRRLGYDLESPFWSVVLSYLNLLVCSLALSTLTTRFIYPQFSLEGQRLWMLGMSPVPMARMLSLKLRLNAGVMAVLTTCLMLVSSFTISLPVSKVLFFVAAIVMLSFGLTALSLALGALVPNFREPNPAKIVSGFGGTLCLILSFLYIMISVAILVTPSLRDLRPGAWGSQPREADAPISSILLSLGGVGVTSVLFGWVPFLWAKKRTKNMEYLICL